jgi:DNA-binding response OmpR family regulator
MSRQGRILIVENEQRWQDALTGILQRDKYQVEVAATIEQAEEFLKEKFFHMAILDIRMDNQDDPTDIEGIKLLRQLSVGGLTESMSVVVLSAYGDKKQMREGFTRHGVADFLDKTDFDNREFIERVKQIFAQNVRINLNLDIQWQQGSADQAVFNLNIDGERIKSKSPLRAPLAQELDDLLCRLFQNADGLLVRLLTSGHSGSAVLMATSTSITGTRQPSIVKFGDVQVIADESKRYANYVKGYIGGGRTSAILELRRTKHLGGIIYSLLGKANKPLESFGSFYRRASLPQIKAALDNLFLNTCAQWYANAGSLVSHDLTEEYLRTLGLEMEALEQNRNYLKAQGVKKLRMGNLSGDRLFTNPILAAATHHFREHTYICPTHGDLSESNVLVDGEGHTWLIDFGRTGPGHILRDVAELDASVRIQLLDENEATLNERLEMEETLCRAEQFDDLSRLTEELKSENQALAKNYATAIHLRTLAYKLVGRNLNASLREYYVAVFYYALGYVRYYDLPKIQREHALLSASLLADCMGLGG